MNWQINSPFFNLFVLFDFYPSLKIAGFCISLMYEHERKGRNVLLINARPQEKEGVEACFLY
jgi:hypothetical protein